MTARLKPGNITQFAMDETVSVVGLHASFGPEVVSRCCAGQLFCTQCATNLAFRMGPGAPDLDAVASDLEVVDRVAAGAYIDTDAHTHVCTQSMYMVPVYQQSCLRSKYKLSEFKTKTTTFSNKMACSSS